MADEIAAKEKKFKNPGPNVFNPNHDQVHRRLASCLNFKGERVSFIADAQAKGESSADFYSKNHLMVEKRTKTPVYRPPGKHDLAGPAFLNKSTATKLISPVTYNMQESFKSTQTKRTQFYSSKGKNNSMVDQAIKRGKEYAVCSGYYDIDKINRGYKSITLGASRGWK